MIKQTMVRGVLGLALLLSYAQVQAKPPTCGQPLGNWYDELKSIMAIRSYDPRTGAISGQYISKSGAGSWPMVGWINPAPAESGPTGTGGKGDRGDVFTLLVRWTDPGAVTAWTGICSVNAQSGHSQILTLWHTARSNTAVPWEHTLTGSELFVPVE